MLNFCFTLGFAHLSDFKREAQVFGNRHMREKGVVLEHHADATLVRWNIVDRLPIKANIAVGCRLKPCEHHQAGRLARTRWPKHCQKLALGQ